MTQNNNDISFVDAANEITDFIFGNDEYILYIKDKIKFRDLNLSSAIIDRFVSLTKRDVKYIISDDKNDNKYIAIDVTDILEKYGNIFIDELDDYITSRFDLYKTINRLFMVEYDIKYKNKYYAGIKIIPRLSVNGYVDLSNDAYDRLFEMVVKYLTYNVAEYDIEDILYNLDSYVYKIINYIDNEELAAIFVLRDNLVRDVEKLLKDIIIFANNYVI